MTPTVQRGERVQIETSTYKQHRPERWDVVLFNHPEGAPGDGPSLMRIVGLPGETISFDSDQVHINGAVLPSPASSISHVRYRAVAPSVPPKTKAGRPRAEFPYVVPANCYFVLGDNSADSYDSRFWGALPQTMILGKAMLPWFLRPKLTERIIPER